MKYGKAVCHGQHIELLKEYGIGSVILLWASYLQAGFWAIR